MKYKATIFLLVVVLLLSACRNKSATSQDSVEIHPELENIPVYPEATAWMDGLPGVDQTTEKYQTYSDSLKTIQLERIVEFYEQEMPIFGWELFQTNEDRKTKSADLMFAKRKTVAHIQIFSRITGVYTVLVVFYDDPVLEEQQE